MPAPTKSATAPVHEIGYQQAVGQYMWWLYENETTPELIWPQSVYVYDQMRRTDSQVGSILRAVNLLVLRTPWRIDPNGARAEVVELVANDLGLPIVGQSPKAPPRTKDRFSWKDHLTEALLMLPLGYSYFEQVYRIDADGGRAHLRKLALRPARTIEYVNVADDGGLVSIKQYWVRSGERPQPIPVDHLVAYIHAKEGGNWLGTSILRNCYKNWLLKDRLLRVQAQTIERNGMGIPLYTGPEGATDLSAGLAMAKAWRAGEAAGSAVPYGATLKLVGVEGTLPDAEPAIRYHDESIAKTVLAHFLNLGQQMGTGSYALGTTLGDFFTLGVQTVAQQIADVANSHVVEDLVDINFGEDEPAPRITFDEIGSRQAATAQALKLLIDAGVIHSDDILEESTRQQYGLPPRDPNAPPPGPLPGLTRETLTGPVPGSAPADSAQMGAQSVAAKFDPKGVAAEAVDESADDLDDDEATDALIAALDEFEGRVEASFNPAQHPRNPKGGPGGGRFRSLVDRIGDALDVWKSGDGHDEPLKGFDRTQLRTVAKTRGISLKRGAPREDIARAILDDLKVKVRDQRDNPTPKQNAKFTLKGGAPDLVKAREVEVENRIRAAYRAVLAREGRHDGGSEWVGLADLRKELGDSTSRHEVDAALKRLAVSQDAGSANVVPESNQKTLTPADRAAAVHFGDQDKHAISFEDASPQPLPGASKFRNKDVGVYQEADGKVSLYEESGSGARGARVVTVDDLAGLERWANDNGETELAHWARSEGGTPSGTHALLVARPGQPGLTAAQKAAVQRYTNSDVVTAQVNGILREDKPHTALIHRLDEAMASSRTTEPMMVFRGIAERPGFGQEGGTQKALGLTGSSLPENLVGHEWTEPSFASTSTRKGIAEVFSSGDNAVLLEIHIPKGTHAIARPGGEEEVLLDRGLTYRVTGDRTQTTMVGIRGDEPSHKRILEVAVVPAAKEPAPVKPAPRKAVPKGDLTGDLTGANGLSSDPAVRDVQVENRIREAYRAAYKDAHGSTPDMYVGLAAIRDHLGESMSRKDVDAALMRMAVESGGRRDGSVQIVPVENSRALTQADRDSALKMGGEDHHAIKIPDPSPRPLPTTDQPSAPAKAATPKRLRDVVTGDVVIWEAPGEVPTLGRVTREPGKGVKVDWSGGRREHITTARLPKETHVRVATPAEIADHGPIQPTIDAPATPAAKPPTASTPDATLATLRGLSTHDEVWSAASKMKVDELKATLAHMGDGQGLSKLRKGALVDRLAGTWPEMRVDAPSKAAVPKADGGQGSSILTQEDLQEGLTDSVQHDLASVQIHVRAASRVAERWDVAPADLEALAREDGTWDFYSGLPADEQKKRFLQSQFAQWDSGSGKPVSVMAIQAAARESGVTVDLNEREQRIHDWVQAHPDAGHAAESMGRAMYAATQEWFRERGITSVKAQRATFTPGTEDANLYTSWSAMDAGNYLQQTSQHSVVEADIPVAQIFSVPGTGYGSPAEAEFVVIGGVPSTTIYMPDVAN